MYQVTCVDVYQTIPAETVQWSYVFWFRNPEVGRGQVTIFSERSNLYQINSVYQLEFTPVKESSEL